MTPTANYVKINGLRLANWVSLKGWRASDFSLKVGEDRNWLACIKCNAKKKDVSIKKDTLKKCLEVLQMKDVFSIGSTEKEPEKIQEAPKGEPIVRAKSKRYINGMVVDPDKVKRVCSEKGFTYAELSRKMGKGNSYISSMSCKGSKDFNDPNRYKMALNAFRLCCEILECQPEDILWKEPEPVKEEVVEEIIPDMNSNPEAVLEQTDNKDDRLTILLMQLIAEQVETRKVLQSLVEGQQKLLEKQVDTHTQLCRIRARLESPNPKSAIREFGNPKAKEIILNMCGTKFWAAEENILKEAEKQKVPVGDMKDMLIAMGGEKQVRGFGDKAYRIWLIPKEV